MFEGISRQGSCVHIGCERKRHAKGLCRSHYEALHYSRWRENRKLRERELSVSENKAIDYDDFWLWVKKELNITT